MVVWYRVWYRVWYSTNPALVSEGQRITWQKRNEEVARTFLLF